MTAKRKPPHVWAVERYYDFGWNPITAVDTRINALASKEALRKLDRSSQFRVSKYVRCESK